MAYAVVVRGRVAGTSVTFDDGVGEAHRVIALADPSGWGRDDVELWQVVEGANGDLGITRLPSC